MRKFLIFFLAISFSQEFNWEVITSILNPTDVQILSPSEVYASTNGGVVKYSLDSGLYEEIGFDQGIHPLDLKSLKVDNNFLSLSDKDGTLQVYSFKDGYVDKVNHLDFIDEITDLNIFQDYLFAIGNNGTKDGLLQFKGYGNQIYYNSFFQNFPYHFLILMISTSLMM